MRTMDELALGAWIASHGHHAKTPDNQCMGCLAVAEIERLRGIVERADKNFAYFTQVEAAEQRLRLGGQALCEQWRELAQRCNDPRSPSIYIDCAEDLARILGL